MNEELSLEFSRQINREFHSAYLYYAMSAYFTEINFDGFAKLMKEQAKEELGHAQKMYDYLLFRKTPINFERIEAPDTMFSNTLDVFSKALEHEKFITDEILKLYEKAQNTKDIGAEFFLEWFIKEQEEEINKFQTIKERIKYANEGCECNIRFLDEEMKK